VQQLAYEPYGNTVYGTGNNEPSRQFTGQIKDGTGLYFYNARYYNPTLSRFTTADTVLDGLNRYTYCGNNPVRYTDPSGNEVVLTQDYSGGGGDSYWYSTNSGQSFSYDDSSSVAAADRWVIGTDGSGNTTATPLPGATFNGLSIVLHGRGGSGTDLAAYYKTDPYLLPQYQPLVISAIISSLEQKTVTPPTPPEDGGDSGPSSKDIDDFINVVNLIRTVIEDELENDYRILEQYEGVGKLLFNTDDVFYVAGGQCSTTGPGVSPSGSFAFLIYFRPKKDSLALLYAVIKANGLDPVAIEYLKENTTDFHFSLSADLGIGYSHGPLGTSAANAVFGVFKNQNNTYYNEMGLSKSLGQYAGFSIELYKDKIWGGNINGILVNHGPSIGDRFEIHLRMGGSFNF